MKIAIPTNEPSKNGNLFDKFGRSPYFLVYDTDSKSTKVIENKSIYATSGAGSQTAHILLKEGINAIIIDTIGPKARDILLKSKITIFDGIKGTTKENLENFDSNI